MCTLKEDLEKDLRKKKYEEIEKMKDLNNLKIQITKKMSIALRFSSPKASIVQELTPTRNRKNTLFTRNSYRNA